MNSIDMEVFTLEYWIGLLINIVVCCMRPKIWMKNVPSIAAQQGLTECESRLAAHRATRRNWSDVKTASIAINSSRLIDTSMDAQFGHVKNKGVMS